MQSSSTLRSVLLYGLVGLVLLAAIVLGIQFVKNRNTSVANTPEPVAQQPTEQPGGQTPQPTPTPTAEQPAPTTTTPSTPSPSVADPVQVPATGLEDSLTVAASLAVCVFSAFMYVQSRQRLSAHS